MKTRTSSALLLEQQGERTAARGHFQRALQLRPDYPEPSVLSIALPGKTDIRSGSGPRKITEDCPPSATRIAPDDDGATESPPLIPEAFAYRLIEVIDYPITSPHGRPKPVGRCRPQAVATNTPSTTNNHLWYPPHH